MSVSEDSEAVNLFLNERKKSKTKQRRSSLVATEALKLMNLTVNE